MVVGGGGGVPGDDGRTMARPGAWIRGILSHTLQCGVFGGLVSL